MAKRKPCKQCKGTGQIKGTTKSCGACDGWGKEGGAPEEFKELFRFD